MLTALLIHWQENWGSVTVSAAEDNRGSPGLWIQQNNKKTHTNHYIVLGEENELVNMWSQYSNSMPNSNYNVLCFRYRNECDYQEQLRGTLEQLNKVLDEIYFVYKIIEI